VQNVLSRRAKLRLLDLEAALAAARAAIRASTPETPAYGGGQLGVAFAQADRLGGTVYDLHAREDGSIDLLLAVPAGAGVDAAFASIVLRDLYRRQGRAADPAARISALLAEYDASPLSRAVELLCAHFGRDGIVRGVVAGLRAPVLIDGAGALRDVALGAAQASGSQRLAAPLRAFECALADGTFALFDDGMAPEAARRFDRTAALERIADHLTRRRQDPQTAAEDVVAEAVKRYRKRHSDDFFALVARGSSRA
jgi:hypothetical protein